MKTIIYIIIAIAIIAAVISKPKEVLALFIAYVLYLFALIPIVIGTEHDLLISVLVMVFDEKWHFLLFLAIVIFAHNRMNSSSS